MPDDASVDALIAADDVAGLMRCIDGLCAVRDWDGLAGLALRCRQAAEWGRQLWPVALHADYRSALEAPPRAAADVLRHPPSRFSPGPLTEVVASSHTWLDVCDYIDDPRAAAAVAQERVLRGEDLRDDDAALATANIGEMPLVAVAGESDAELLPVYRSHEFSVPDVDSPPGATVVSVPRVRSRDDAVASAARRVFHALFETWLTESNGKLLTATAPGDTAEDVVGAIAGDVICETITPGRALALMTWSAANGGAHGRRRGGAAGRLQAWWAAASLCGSTDEWPIVDSDRFVHDVMAEREWCWWQPVPRPPGWLAGLAVTDPNAGVVHAALATDNDEVAP